MYYNIYYEPFCDSFKEFSFEIDRIKMWYEVESITFYEL